MIKKIGQLALTAKWLMDRSQCEELDSVIQKLYATTSLIMLNEMNYLIIKEGEKKK